jgi:hypothetical protein
MELPQEYWRHRTLFEIARAIGTPLSLDEATKNRMFGHYARILVDIDLSRRIFDEIVVERDGYVFKLAMIYKRLPDFCGHCSMIGHDITTCKWLRQQTVEDNSKQIVKVKKEAAKVMKYVAKQQHVPVIIPAQSSVVPEVPKADKLITAVDVSHASVADAGKVVIDDEVTPKQDVETAYKARTAAPQITSFSMPLKDVTDEIVQGELAVSEPVLQQITEPVDSEKMVDATSDDGEEIVIETQLTRVVNDEEFDDVVQKELQVVKQIWADMADNDKQFTPVVSKSQKKRNRQKMRSAGQPYHTRSKGARSHMSLWEVSGSC